MDNTKNLKWGVFFSYLTMVAGIIVSMTYTPFLLRSLGTQQYGLYNMGQAAVSYLGLTEFGFGNAVVRYASKYRAEENNDKASSVYGMFMYIYGILALFILIVGTVICIYSDHFYTVTSGAQGYRELRIIIMIMVINLALTFVMQPYSSIITSYERFAFVKVTNLVYTILKPVVMIPLLIWGYKAVALSVLTLILQQILNLSNVFYVKKVLKIKINFQNKKIDFKILKEIAQYSFFIFLGSVASQINDNTDTVILGIISGEVAVAVYSIGYQLNTYIQQIPGIISSVFFPRVTARITRGASMDDMTNLLIRVGRIQCFFVMLLVSGFSLFGQEFIYMWAGNEYRISYWIVLVLIIPAAIPNMQSIGVLIMQAQNKHQFRAILYVGCAFLNIILSIPAGLMFGPIGCAVCTGLTTLLTCGFIMNWYYKYKMRLNMGHYWKSICLMWIKAVPVLFIGIGLNLIIYSKTWIAFFIKVIIYFICYVFYAILIVANVEERENAFLMIRNMWHVKKKE